MLLSYGQGETLQSLEVVEASFPLDYGTGLLLEVSEIGTPEWGHLLGVPNENDWRQEPLTVELKAATRWGLSSTVTVVLTVVRNCQALTCAECVEQGCAWSLGPPPTPCNGYVCSL